MALNESDDDEYHSLASPTHEDVGDTAGEDDGESTSEPPVHPIPSMQAAFEESIQEATTADGADDGSASTSAESRRRQLLENHRYDDSWKIRLKQRPGAQYHPLLKLIAQIVFGLHLLQQEQAKSNEEVVKILQTHVDEVDGFLERTSDDFDLANTDIEERIRHLKLPMQHLEVFDNMLDDKSFRTQLLDGNDKIERIIDRTAKAMNAALMDIQRGLHATQELGKYLDSVKDQWPNHDKAIVNVYVAMRGNEQGWLQYLKNLQIKGTTLGNALVQLGTVIGEMAKLAAAASRRNRPTSPPGSSKSMPTSSAPRSKFSRGGAEAPPVPSVGSRKLSLNKALPREPDAVDGAAQVAIPKFHPVPSAQRYERPRQTPPSPHRRTATEPTTPRPKTAGEPRDPMYSRMDTSQLTEFLQVSGPLRSNPPDRHPSTVKKGASPQAKRLTRSQSQGAGEMMMGDGETLQEPRKGGDRVVRSKTHGGAVIVRTPRGKEKKSVETTRSTNSEPGSRKDSALPSSTGFRRRFSKSMKSISPIHASGSRSTATDPTTTTTNESQSSPVPVRRANKLSTTFEPTDTISTARANLPTDSAYASPTTNNVQNPKIPPLPEEPSLSTTSARSARLILFPNNSSRPFTPSAPPSCRPQTSELGVPPVPPGAPNDDDAAAAATGTARHEVDGDGGQTTSGEVLPNVATATAGTPGAAAAEASPSVTQGVGRVGRADDDYTPSKVRGVRIRDLFHRRKDSGAVFASS